MPDGTNIIVSVVLLTCEASPALAQEIQQVQHIVFIVKENHTYDNYFGQFPGGNGATAGVFRGKQVPLRPAPDSAPNLCHLRKCAWEAYAFGAMDDFCVRLRRQRAQGCRCSNRPCPTVPPGLLEIVDNSER